MIDTRRGLAPLNFSAARVILTLQGVQIVAQRAARNRLPMAVRRQRLSICSLIQVSPMRSPRSKYAVAA